MNSTLYIDANPVIVYWTKPFDITQNTRADNDSIKLHLEPVRILSQTLLADSLTQLSSNQSQRFRAIGESLTCRDCYSRDSQEDCDSQANDKSIACAGSTDVCMYSKDENLHVRGCLPLQDFANKKDFCDDHPNLCTIRACDQSMCWA
ncbi:uncharacterized protein LOC116604450 [Nematostella vectensis]|uniref:uncharacterized protein LOC116604450 n=1 Tax=Nematostella vectensis TaxID=45351 RepID=UPI001390183E|nr:uncharacterized protein LOC116604450 [Nematostella vectensis]